MDFPVLRLSMSNHEINQKPALKLSLVKLESHFSRKLNGSNQVPVDAHPERVQAGDSELSYNLRRFVHQNMGNTENAASSGDKRS